MKKILFAILTTTALSIPSFANLLTNGNFDTTDGTIGLVHGQALNSLSTPPGSTWDVFAIIPGQWQTLNGYGIEVQANGTVGGVSAHSGSLYVELDSHPHGSNSNTTNSSMFQNVNLGIGDYVLSFWYRPRTDTANDNGIQVRIGSDPALGNLTGVSSSQNSWQQYSYNFSVTAAGSKQIIFEATGLANQLGGFIDTVSLLQRNSGGTNETIPEPSTFALLGAALVGLGIKLRRR